MRKAKRRVVALLRIAKQALEAVPYHLLGLMPRDTNLWVFGAWKKGFVDNPKHFFIATSSDPNISVRCVWISRSRKTVRHIRELGFEAASLYSPKGIWSCVRAAKYFYNSSVINISFILSKDALLINLWHGIPLKKIIWDSRWEQYGVKPPQKVGIKATFLRLLQPRYMYFDDYLLSPSNYVTEYSFASAFDVPAKQCLPLGYPRTDLFFWSDRMFRQYIEAYEEPLHKLIKSLGEHQKLYLYAPTYRNTDNDLITKSGLDLEDLDNRLHDEGSFLLLKFHPSVQPAMASLAGLKNIKLLDSHIDVNPLLVYIDVLITDYSSIYFDFLLLNRPIIFFCFDLESYMKNSRSLYFDYHDAAPGKKPRNYEQLCEVLFSNEEREWEMERVHTKNRFWGAYNGAASQKLSKIFKPFEK